MAATATGAALTAAQHAAQARIAQDMAADLLRVWPLLDPLRLDQTSPAWIALVMALIGQHRRVSAQTAATYYQQFRRAETDHAVVHHVPLDAAINTRQVGTSLLVTGPVGIKQRIGKGDTPDRAARLALVETTGAATRHVLNGGRETLIEAVHGDDVAVGYARVTGPNPCAFCAMLASRGFVYRSRASASETGGRRSKRGAGQPFHDHDQCSVEPAFSHDAPLPGRSQEFVDLWNASTVGEHGKDAVAAFRKALDQWNATPAPAG